MKRMNRLIVTLGWILISTIVLSGQQKDSIQHTENSAEKLLKKSTRLTIGGYGEVHYNQELDKELNINGKLDVHRMVMLFGYSFSNRTQFITEIEFEHVKEVYIEQAFLQHRLNNYINIRAGLLLIPMGIINEYHEPTAFHGVERPGIDKSISPTTWREVGLGITGNILPASLKYQLYLVNGFNGYDGEGKFSGQGLRGGRQKGAESYISSPNLTTRISYYGLRGLNLGLSGYFGKTQSSLYDGISKSDDFAQATADSSVLGISMLGVDARYSRAGFQFRGQLYLTGLSNTQQYNYFTTRNDSILNDVGSQMYGYYVELAYNILRLIPGAKAELTPFVRYEAYDTQSRIHSDFAENANYAVQLITAGLNYKLSNGAVLKTDLQFKKVGRSPGFSTTLNAGLGVMF